MQPTLTAQMANAARAAEEEVERICFVFITSCLWRAQVPVGKFAKLQLLVSVCVSRITLKGQNVVLEKKLQIIQGG